MSLEPDLDPKHAADDDQIHQNDGSSTLAMPCTTALGIITFLIEAIIVAEITLGDDGGSNSNEGKFPLEPETAMRTWAGTIWASWLGE